MRCENAQLSGRHDRKSFTQGNGDRRLNPSLTLLHLASTSSRRRQLLDEAGFGHQAIDPGVDDGALTPARTTRPEHWVAALAHLKAMAGVRQLEVENGSARGGLVIGADTIVVKEGEIIGQPRDREHAGSIIRRLASGEHRVITGVALIEPGRTPGVELRRLLLVDAANVRIGKLDRDSLDAYLESDDWRGKAGAYNLSERIQGGWPISFDGDPATIMGLPIRRLTPLLHRRLNPR